MMFKGLSGNALKVIAIIAMTIDHLAWVGIETYEQAETPTQISWVRALTTKKEVTETSFCDPLGARHRFPETL